MRMVFWITALSIWANASIAQDLAQSLKQLLIEQRCPVADQLRRIYFHVNPKKDHGRFLVLELRKHKHAYVQCIFGNNKTILLCEAASGAHYGRNGVRMPFRQPPETEAALARLGYDVSVTNGNYRKETAIGSKQPNFEALADFMLTSLHDGYGADASTEIEANAPFAPPPYKDCVPLS